MRPGMVIGEQLEDGVKESVVEGRGVNESDHNESLIYQMRFNDMLI